MRGSGKASSSKAADPDPPQDSDAEIVSPTPKRSRKDSVAPGFVPVNARPSTPTAVSTKSKAPKKQKGSPKKPVAPKIPVDQFIPNHLRTFMNDSKVSSPFILRKNATRTDVTLLTLHRGLRIGRGAVSTSSHISFLCAGDLCPMNYVT